MPTRSSSPSSLLWTLRGLGDLAIGLFSLYLAFVIRIRLPVPMTSGLMPTESLANFFIGSSILIALTQNLALYFFGFYDHARPLPRLELLRRLLAATTLQGLLLMAFYFLTAQRFPRSVLVGFVPIHLALLFGYRYLLQSVQRVELRRVAIVGTSTAARELARDIERHHWQGLVVAGHLPSPDDSAEAAADPPEELGPRLGTVDTLPDLFENDEVDVVILASREDDWRTGLVDRLARRPQSRRTVLLLPNPFDSLVGRARFRAIHDVALIDVMRQSEWHLNRPLKRLFDLTAATLLLLLATPIMVVCALIVRLTSRGPVLYRQERIGRGLRAFRLVKFRTMVQDAERGTGEIKATPGDPRVTAFGRFLRSARLDELPQLFHVLSGTMSLVGPRPERPRFVHQYLDEIPGYIERFSIRPGLTGLAQINGDYHSSPQNKLRYDLAYLANSHLWLDLSILFRTVRIVLSTRGT